MKRRLAQALVVVVLAFLGAVVLRVAVSWLFGASPYVQYLKLIHDDIPRLVIPVRLEQGEPVTFQARIIYKRSYELNLLVYFRGNEQRAVEDLIGGPIGQPINAGQPPGKLPTTIRITVQDQDRRVVHDRTGRSDGRIVTASHFLGRDLGLLPLGEGLYTISVTPLSDVSALVPFRTELELTSLAK
jgi:hypothetical protein